MSKKAKKVIGVTDPLVVAMYLKAANRQDTRPSVRARKDLELVEVWIAGMRKEVPRQLAFLMQGVETEADPEYLEYLRLKERFER